MKKYPRSHEPIVWSLFGAGGMVVAFVLPALILTTGIIVPLGFAAESALSYQRALMFAQSWWGALFIFGIIALPLFHAAHRIYHSMHDLHIHGPKNLMLALFYGGASLLSLITVYALFAVR